MPPTGERDFGLAVLVGILIVLGRGVDFRISAAGATHMGTPAVLVGVLLLDPLSALFVAAAGSAISDGIQRFEPPRLFFNSGQSMFQALVAIAILDLIGWNASQPAFDDPLQVMLIFAIGLVMIFVSVFMVSVAAWLESSRDFLPLLREVLFGGSSKLYLIDFSKICFGIVAAMLVTWTPIYLALIIIPLVTMSHAIGRAMGLSKQLEDALQQTEDSLAEAQRLAKLGSWEWELAGRHMRVSDQMSEILGLEPTDELESIGDLRKVLRVADRQRLERAIGRVVETQGEAEFDHAVLRPDGSVRYVHHVMAWAQADDRGGDRLVGTMLDITERKRLELELRYQAFHDGLTGLPNRELFIERLEGCLASGRNRDRAQSVIFIDLDYFKEVNDRYGHEAGDAVLVEVARRLRRQVGEHATVARLGGDEFTVLAANADTEGDVEPLAELLLVAIQQPILVGEEQIIVTASAGLVHITNQHQTASDVLREVDHALYSAKDSGRNRLRVEESARRDDRSVVLRSLA